MKIYENSFYILGASPREDRHQLMQRADEASLSGGISVEDSVSALMQMNRRIVAELGWLPGAEPAVAASFASYAKTISEGGSAPFPALDGLESPLARANALSVLFEIWPDSLPIYTIGLFRSMDMVLSKITVSDTFALINEDRKKGGWESIPDETAIAGLLEDRIRELSSLVEFRMEHMDIDEKAAMLDKLFSYKDFDLNGQVCRTASNVYTMCIRDEEKILRDKILTDLKNYSERKNFSYAPTIMQIDVEKWCKLTYPLRKMKGPEFLNAALICGIYRHCIVEYFNNSPARAESRTEVRGGRTYTISYKSRGYAANKAEELTVWLIKLFPEQTDLVMRLLDDQKALADVVPAEERNRITIGVFR